MTESPDWYSMDEAAALAAAPPAVAPSLCSVLFGPSFDPEEGMDFRSAVCLAVAAHMVSQRSSLDMIRTAYLAWKVTKGPLPFAAKKPMSRLAPHIAQQMEFNPDDLASKWHIAPLLSADPQIQRGRICIDGTRMTIDTFHELTKAGDTFDSILRDYSPYLTKEALRAALDCDRVPQRS